MIRAKLERLGVEGRGVIVDGGAGAVESNHTGNDRGDEEIALGANNRFLSKLGMTEKCDFHALLAEKPLRVGGDPDDGVVGGELGVIHVDVDRAVKLNDAGGFIVPGIGVRGVHDEGICRELRTAFLGEGERKRCAEGGEKKSDAAKSHSRTPFRIPCPGPFYRGWKAGGIIEVSGGASIDACDSEDYPVVWI